MPEISVIIPNYNHASYLKQRIDSVLNQTYQDFEIIILDDASSDGSKAIIENYRANPKVKHIVYNEKNSGSSFRQWAKGLFLAKGNKIWIAESDDWAEPKLLETLLKRMNENENVGIAFCDSNWVDDKGKIGEDRGHYKETFFIEGKKEIKRALYKYNTIQNASSALIRKDLALKHIMYIQAYRSCGDWFFYVCILHESNLFFVNEKLNNFRWYHSNVSNRAKESGLWASEGIDVLKNIKPKLIRFKMSEIKEIRNFWLNSFRKNKTKHSIANKLHFFQTLNGFMIRYFFS